MDPMAEEQLDYGEDDYAAKPPPLPYPAAIPALADEEDAMADEDDYDDLYNDVNVGEAFMRTIQQHRPAAAAANAAPLAAPQPLPPSIPEAELKPAPAMNYPEEAPQKPAADPPPRPAADPKFPGGPSSAPPALPSRPPAMVMNEVPRLAVAAVEVVDGPTTLYVGELQWWTTDAELEGVLSRYGRVKEIRFFDERASGKSKGYCQVDFYDPRAAAAAKDGVNGYVFNGRACVVTFASPQTLRQMGAAYASKNQNQNQTQGQGQGQSQGRRMMNDGMGRGGGGSGGGGGMNYQGRGGNWGRGGGQGMFNRGQGGAGPMRGRGNMGGRNMGGGGAGAGGGPFGQGLGGPMLGGPAGGLMHPQGMMGTGFDPMYMGRGGPYGGFSAPAFPGMMPSFQAVNTVGLPGVAPHVNPAFFSRGMSANGMGMMGGGGMDGQSAGMWTDPSMGGWVGEEHGRRTRESSYGGDDGASEYGYGEVNHERGGKSNASREKDRGAEDWSGNSERRHRDEREQDWERSDRDRYREEKDGYRDHRQRDRDRDNGEDWDRGQHSSRSGSRSRMMREEEHRSRSRDIDYGKRRRIPSD